MFNLLQPFHNGTFPTTKTRGNEADLPTQALLNLLVCSLLGFFASWSHQSFTWLTVYVLCCSHALPLHWQGFARFSSNLLTFCSWACLTRWNEISAQQSPPCVNSRSYRRLMRFLGQLVISQVLSCGGAELCLCSKAGHLCNKAVITLPSYDQWVLCKY